MPARAKTSRAAGSVWTAGEPMAGAPRAFSMLRQRKRNEKIVRINTVATNPIKLGWNNTITFLSIWDGWYPHLRLISNLISFSRLTKTSLANFCDSYDCILLLPVRNRKAAIKCPLAIIRMYFRQGTKNIMLHHRPICWVLYFLFFSQKNI